MQRKPFQDPLSSAVQRKAALEDPAFKRSFKAGEAAALQQLYVALVDDVSRLLRFGFHVESTGNRVFGFDAERVLECTQETFARALSERGRQSYDGLSPLRPWLLRITKNLMIDLLRKKRELHAADLVDDQAFGLLVDEASTAEAVPEHDSVDEKRLRLATAAFTRALQGEALQVFALRFEHGLAQHAVASQLGVTRRRVRTVEDGLRAALFNHLQQAGLADLLLVDGGHAAGGLKSGLSVGMLLVLFVNGLLLWELV
jgi:RNA polymerase sigma factor (sigma-70 family)